MSRRAVFSFLILGILGLLGLGVFQNCSPVSFGPATNAPSGSTSSTAGPVGQSPPANGGGSTDQTIPPSASSSPSAPPTTSPPLPPVCPAGQTYNGTMCVPFAAVCKEYVELTGTTIAVPPRSEHSICYYIKMVNSRPTVSSSAYPDMRNDVAARSHDGITPHPRIMGSTQIGALTIQGDREIILSGSSDGTAKIMVDNFFLLEALFSDEQGAAARTLFGQGTADAPIPGQPLLVDTQEVTYIPGKSGGTDIINPVDLKPFIPINKTLNLRISSLDCGGVGGTTDIYILFR